MDKPYHIRMKINLKSISSLALICFLCSIMTTKLHAQDFFGGGAGPSAGTDSGDSAVEVTPEPAKPTYQRFLPPYDSLRELVYYEGIVEDEAAENPSADSLWFRCKKFLASRYGKENAKRFVVEEKKPDKIVLKCVVPMAVQIGKYNKSEAGKLEYKLTIRFKDGYRYKYQITNFVHVYTPTGTAQKEARTYHEYYMKAKSGFQVSDRYLISADREVQEIVAGLKRALREPYQPNEDDW